MALKLYNTLTRKKEVFRPINDRRVGFYSCGPTVYNFPHIGNYRAFVFFDILRRTLEHKTFNVKHVMNLTDVDDKTIKGAQKENLSLKDFTAKYTQAFMEDLKTLNIRPAHVFPKATEHIGEMISMIKRLERKGFTYKGDDGIYFNIQKFKDYGKLSKIDKSKLRAGARVSQDEYDKKNVADFVLWKFYRKEDGPVFWKTDYGRGRPGWHIECSAMSTKYLGNSFDIHAGGVDLIFPHHENEIAQSEGASGKQFAKYWLHNEFILVEGKKMSKSLGNFYTLRDLICKGYDSRAIRYLLLSAHYRQQLNFTFDALDASKTAVDRIQELYEKLICWHEAAETENLELEHYSRRFEQALDDDLNMPEALAVVFDFVKYMNVLISEKKISSKTAKKALKLLLSFDDVLGIIETARDIPEKVINLAEQRKIARERRDFKKADKLREEIKLLGYYIDDSKEGYRIKKL